MEGDTYIIDISIMPMSMPVLMSNPVSKPGGGLMISCGYISAVRPENGFLGIFMNLLYVNHLSAFSICPPALSLFGTSRPAVPPLPNFGDFRMASCRFFLKIAPKRLLRVVSRTRSLLGVCSPFSLRPSAPSCSEGRPFPSLVPALSRSVFSRLPQSTPFGENFRFRPPYLAHWSAVIPPRSGWRDLVGKRAQG